MPKKKKKATRKKGTKHQFSAAELQKKLLARRKRMEKLLK
jgi:hypothetical protein